MDDNDRFLHLIVDASVLVYGGLDQLIKWADDHQHYRPAIYYIPAYTLRELDFLKKSFNPVVSRNARRSIKFIDQAVSRSADRSQTNIGTLDTSFSEVSDFESYNNTKKEFERQKKLLDATFALKSLTISSNGDENADLVLERREQEYGLYEEINANKKADKMKEEGYFESEEGPIRKSNVSQDISERSEFILEPPEKAGPIWKIASSYRERTPLKKEFPSLTASDGSRIGVFGGRMSGSFASVRAPGSAPSLDRDHSAHGKKKVSMAQLTEHEIKEKMEREDQSLEEIMSELRGVNEGDEKARIPKNLKLLIRSAVQLQRIDNKDRPRSQKINWTVISEDITTQIWLKCFNIPVINLSDANEALSLQSKNEDEDSIKKLPAEEAAYSLCVDSGKNGKGRRKKKGTKKKSGSKFASNSSSDDISFAGITYAPRGKGKLWTP